MEDRITDDFVSIATAVESHLERVARAGTDHLAIEIRAFVAVRRLQPLVRVLVMNVCRDRAAVMNSELRVIVDVAVKDVRRIVGIVSFGRLRERRQFVRESIHGSRDRHTRVSAIRIRSSAGVAELGRSAEHRRCC